MEEAVIGTSIAQLIGVVLGIVMFAIPLLIFISIFVIGAVQGCLDIDLAKIIKRKLGL